MTYRNDKPASTVSSRVEHDFLGEKLIPIDRYYGIQTSRAAENFQVTGFPISSFPKLIRAIAAIKKAAAETNRQLGLLPNNIADVINGACDEILQNQLFEHFIVDLIQGGAGTSTNMNVNEVVANRALELLGHEKGQYHIVNPNDHVNLSQSTNDVYPTAIKIALIYSIQELLPTMTALIHAFQSKEQEFGDVLKIGRTQLRDAVPMTLGQEFGAYATTLSEDIERLQEVSHLLAEINLGGTAIGTGINTDPRYSAIVCQEIRDITGLNLKLSPNLIEATQDTGVFVLLSGILKRTAIKLSKICNDLRLLSSGPRAGLNEINLPAVQAGSTIMPGKVNPVIPEMVSQVCYHVMGNDLIVTLAAEAGQLELNAYLPLIAFSLSGSTRMLRNAMITLTNRCITGITANRDHCLQTVQNSLGIATALTPYIGYEKAAEIAQEAFQSGQSVYDLVLSHGILSRTELMKLLSPEHLIKPQRSNKKS
ncbi:MAG: aspartate ammonia-lyase [Candidatus Bathyarchaeota archaeon]|jgi:aspartate ammonia-lyase|nr:aspartate ammonia-lyase [Candidatus Bathyarchaeota archaeon]